MTREEIIEYFKVEENRKEYMGTMPVTVSEKIFENTKNIESVIASEIGHQGVTGDEIAESVEDEFFKRRVFFVTKNGRIGSDPQSIKEEFEKRMQAGDLCIQRKKNQNEIQLYRNETFSFEISFFGGKEMRLDDVEGYHRVPAQKQMECLQQYKFTEEAAKNAGM